MDTIDTRDNHDHRAAGPPPSPSERQARPCPLCGIPNRKLNQDCLNCGWHGASLVDDAGGHESSPGLGPDADLMDSWWQVLWAWLH
jgi:hypothetical protein